MAHFNLENELSNALRLDVPLNKAPLPRWQRKALETSSNRSANISSNDSAILNMSLNKSSAKVTTSPKKTLDEWGKRLTPGRSTSSKSPHANQGDRFIPNRSAMQFDLGHYILTKSTGAEEENLSPNSSNYKKTMSENLLDGDLSNFRILAYQNKAPRATGHSNGLKILYSSSKNPVSAKKTTRHIPQNPERILDAPDILDDYYLNYIDWSTTDILAVALGNALYLWNAASGDISQILEMESAEDYISSVSWLEGGSILAVGSSTSEVQLWDVAAQKRIRTMKSHVSRISSLSWNSYILSSGCRTGAIHHHDVRVAEHHVGSLSGHTQEVCGLKWSPDGRNLASGGNDNLVNIWTSGSGIGQADAQPLNTFNEHQAAVKALAWCPWQPSILASGGGTADRHIRFWNCNLGTSLNSIDAKSQVCAILWSKEYKELISGHGFANNELIIWKYPSMTKVCELTGHTSRILNLAMSPDGSTVVSAGADETLRLWNCFAFDAKKKKTSSTSGLTQKSDMMKQSIR